MLSTGQPLPSLHTLKPWCVTVSGIGRIGAVIEHTEARARLAAVCKYGNNGRRGSQTQLLIFEDDFFHVEKKAA